MIDNKIAIYLAILNQGEVAVELSQWSNAELMNSPYPIFIDYSCEKPISFNRNQIVKRFLERPQYDYLVMIDSDIVPPPNYMKLIDFKKDIISGLCFAFTKGNIFPLILSYGEKTEGNQYKPYNSIHPKKWTGLVECDAVGTGAVVLSRKVLEAIPYPFRNEYDKTGDKLIGLDLNFCHRAKELGFQVFCHTDYVCSHHTRFDLKSIYYTMQKTFDDIDALANENITLKKEYENIKRKQISRKDTKKPKATEKGSSGNTVGEKEDNISTTEGKDVQPSGSEILPDIVANENTFPEIKEPSVENSQKPDGVGDDSTNAPIQAPTEAPTGNSESDSTE